MKKLFFSLLVLTLMGTANAQFTKVGGGLALTSGFKFHQMDYPENRSGLIGLYFKGIYEVSLPLHIAPSFTIFYPHVTKNQFDKTVVSSMMFDINGHYTINSLDRFEFYGLAGLDILFAKKKNTITGSSTYTEKDNALGLNIGVGTYTKLTESMDLTGEIKYLFNNKYNQLMANVGVLINIDWLKKHENTGGL
jgi:opacity protein-like surface antigen